MNLVQNMKWLDEKAQQWEHNLILSSEKMMHKEAFWAVLTLALGVLVLVFLIIWAHENGGTTNPYSTPLSPFNPYAY